jgi:DNA polymerase-3 subunit epsilon
MTNHELRAFLEKTNGKEFFVMDTETTGFFPTSADAIEVSAIRVLNDSGKFKILDTFDTFINPGYPLPSQIVEFNEKNQTGINDELLSTAPSPKEATLAIRKFLGVDDPVIVGHNISFDIRFLNKLYENNTRGVFNYGETLDTLDLCKREFVGKKHNLNLMHQMTDKYFSEIGEAHGYHNSLSDCLATLDVLNYLKDRELAKDKPKKQGQER